MLINHRDTDVEGTGYRAYIRELFARMNMYKYKWNCYDTVTSDGILKTSFLWLRLIPLQIEILDCFIVSIPIDVE